MTMARMLASVLATTTGLAFWWGLTEPLPVPPGILFGVSAGILLCAGVIAGKLGAAAAPCGLLFSLFLGSILATQMHQAFTPSFTPVSHFGEPVGPRAADDPRAARDRGRAWRDRRARRGATPALALGMTRASAKH